MIVDGFFATGIFLRFEAAGSDGLFHTGILSYGFLPSTVALIDCIIARASFSFEFCASASETCVCWCIGVTGSSGLVSVAFSMPSFRALAVALPLFLGEDPDDCGA